VRKRPKMLLNRPERRPRLKSRLSGKNIRIWNLFWKKVSRLELKKNIKYEPCRMKWIIRIQ
jgi:hypothetical protein